MLARFKNLFVGLLLLFFAGGLAVRSSAQNTLVPTWADGGSSNTPNPPQFSQNGAYVLIWQSGFFTVYNVSKSSIVANVKIQEAVSGACFNSSGTGVIYATGQGQVYDYSIVSRTQTHLAINEGAGNSPRLLAASADGKTLAYVISDPSTGADVICLYNLTNNTAIKRFDYVNSGAAKTASLGFANGNQDLVLSGPTLYNFSGARLAAVLNGSYPVAVSPDQTKLFQYGSLDGKYHCYSASSLTSLWSTSNPSINGSTAYGSGPSLNQFTFSFDSKIVYFYGIDPTANYLVGSVDSANGVLLSSWLTVPTGTPGSYPWIIASPTTAEVAIGAGSGNGTLQIWLASTSTGAGSIVSTLASGTTANELFQNFKIASGSSSPPEVGVVGFDATGNISTMIRNADTGAYLKTYPYSQVNDPRLISPTGAYYVGASNQVVSVYNLSSSALIASITLPAGVFSPVWGGSRIAVTDGTNTYVLNFSGSALTRLSTIKAGTYWTFSSDGTQVAALINNTAGLAQARVFNATSGATLYTIAPDANAVQGIVSVAFGGTNRVGVHEVLPGAGSSFIDEYRVFGVSGVTPTLVSKIAYQMGSSVQYNQVAATLSPDGLTVARANSVPESATDPRIGSVIQLYNATTGSLIEEWDNQFAPDLQNEPTSQGSSTFDFSPDGSQLLWNTHNQLVAAPTNSAKVTLGIAPSSVPGGTSCTGTVTVTPTPSVATAVSLMSGSPDASVPAAVTIPANSSSATFTITTKGVATTVSTSISATLVNFESSANIQILAPSHLTLAFSPATVNAGSPSTGTLSVNAAAGPAGLVVNLKNADPTIVGVPTMVTIPSNATSAKFTANTAQPSATTAVTLTGTVGALTASGTLTVTRTASIEASFNVASILGGNAALLTVSLLAPAPAGGKVLTLKSSSAALSPRASVTVPAGQSSAAFGVMTNAVLTNTSAKLTVTGSSNQSATATLVVAAPTLVSVLPDSNYVIGGSPTSATIQLTGIAPAGFNLACSSNSASVAVPGTFTFPTGHASATLAISTKAVTQVTVVTIKVGSKSFIITVLP